MGRSVYRQSSFSCRRSVRDGGRLERRGVPSLPGPVFFWVLLAVLILGPMAVRAADDAPGEPAPGLKVLASGPESLRFSYSRLEPVWTPRTVGEPSVTLYDVSVEGFISSGEPGHVRLPRTGGWVVVPPGTRPEIRPLQEQWLPAGDRPLMVEAVPVIIPGSESWENSVSEILVLPGQDPPAGALVPPAATEALSRRGRVSATAAASLGDVVWWRGRRIVSYQVTPIRESAPGVAAQYLTGGTWEIRFVPDNTAGKSLGGPHARKSSTRNDDRFGDIFLNRELLGQTPAEAAWQGFDAYGALAAEKSAAVGARGGKKGTPLGPETRLAVWKTGLVRVPYARLRERGLIPDGTIREDQIRVFQRRYLEALDDGTGQAPYVEIEVPIHMVGEGDDFDGDDFFVFYGLRPRDDGSYDADFGNGPVTVPGSGDPFEMNNEGNVYWLAASQPDPGAPWSRMATSLLPAASGTPLAKYRRFDHIEENKAFRENLPSGNVDRLYFNTYRTTDARAGINPLWAPDPNGADVDIKVGIAGYSDAGRTIRIDMVTNSLATTQLEDYYISSIDEVQRSYRVPAWTIDGDFAEIHVYIPNVPPNIFSVYTFLNWVDIAYDALYQATNNRLTFPCGTDPGPRPIEVTGFASADIGLVEITDPRNPVLVQLEPGVNTRTADNVSWTLSVMPDQTGQERTFAAVGDFTTDGVDEFPSFLASVALDPANPTDLGGPDPDLIVVSHPDFIPALGRWIDHRKVRAGGDLEVHVVDVEDLYDWYSGGMRDPWAIKRFVNHAITRWNSWALTVVGDANENSLEKGVIPTARGWSKDWVPTHYHSQSALQFNPELMASDKWYVTLGSGQNYPQDNFPADVFAPWDMYTGRFPCNSVAELDIMIDKVMTVENVAAGQDWRRRGIFFADDQWSNGYGAAARDTLVYKTNETVFAISEKDSLARLWHRGSPVALDSVLVLLQDSLDPEMPSYGDPPIAPRDLSDTRLMTAAVSTPILISHLSGGGLVAHYQGHANPYVLSSEYWFEDRNDGVGRKDVAKLGNTDKPWFFMGLGCHVSDWAQNTVLVSTQPHERSISEKFMIKSRSGASATYGSSGYEYITENRLFGEYIFRRWLVNPPAQRSVGAGGAVRSRWITGELMWAAEADIYAVNRGSFVQEMIAQYVLLGDPLMALDAGEPEVKATLTGPVDEEIVGEAEVFATDGTNVRTVLLEARDEAGIDRVQVVDQNDNDVTSSVSIVETLPPGASNHQRVDYSLDVPILPYDHNLTVRVFDTGGPLETDRHYEVLLRMPQTAEFMLGGAAVDPATFVFPAETPLRFSAEVNSAAWLLGYDPSPGGDFTLTSATLALADVEFLLNKNQHLTVNFTATAAAENPDDQHTVVLAIDGYPTDLVLQQGTGVAVSETIGKVYNYPNPMRESTRFVFESGLNASKGVIRVYSVAGRPVARIPFMFTGGGSGVVEWDGRDSAGDEMGNGTYLYRVEIESHSGTVVSDMQRLVMMR